MMFFFGIEHEVAFLNKDGKFADFTCTKFADFNQIIDCLPIYPSDYPQLHVGDAGIRKKRWYIEGFERFHDSDKVIDYIPKGIEIRTTIHSDICSAIAELSESFNLLEKIASNYGFSPVLISHNPYQTSFEPQPALNDYELQILRANNEEFNAKIPMITYGPDLNISATYLSKEQVIDIGCKLNYYSPYIVPFSFSSPFYNGSLWSGLSVRTFFRTGKRPAVTVYLENKEDLIKTEPALTEKSRISAEIGRIEFKAFDSCDDFSIYAGLLALLKGLVLDKTLTGRALIPDAEMHQLSARYGFEDVDVMAIATQVLEAAENALVSDPDISLLTPLQVMLEKRQTPAHQLIQAFKTFGSIEDAIKQTYTTQQQHS
jgi:hypothetical protein